MSIRIHFTQTLLFRVIVAIILGIVCSFFPLEWLARIFVTFNGLSGNLLGFFIPVLIFALIAPAIASLGRGAGKWLGITTAIAYGSMAFSGLLVYAATQGLYPWLLGVDQVGASVNIGEGAPESFSNVEMSPPFDVMIALLLAFIVGVAMTTVKPDSLYHGVTQLRDVIMKITSASITLLLPIHILGVLLSMGVNGNLTTTLSMFLKVLVLVIIGTVLLSAIQFSIAGAIAGRSPWTSLKNALPAYAIAPGTSSLAATTPATYKAALKNGVSEKIAGFTVPLCATIHLTGSMMKITLFAFAVMFMVDRPFSPDMAIGLILTLGITMTATPGVSGGAIMAMASVLQFMLDFDQEQVALTIAAHITIDSFGTACNVTGGGATAVIVNRLVKDDAIDRSEELSFDAEEIDSASSATEA